MATITLKPGQLGAVFKANAKAARRVTHGAAKMAAQRGRSLLVSRSPVDLGQLKNSWRVLKIADGWALVNEAPHAGIIEGGARPHAVSEEGREALAQWVRRHIPVVEIYGRKGFSGKKLATRREAKVGTDVREEIDRIVDAICYRLQSRGYKGKRFVENSLPDLRMFVAEEIREAIKRHVGSVGGSGGKP